MGRVYSQQREVRPQKKKGSQEVLPPNFPTFGRWGFGARLVQGIALAVEPMVTLGGHDTDVLDDEWKVVTADGSWAAHAEHTFALTDRGAWVLTEKGGKTLLKERVETERRPEA